MKIGNDIDLAALGLTRGTEANEPPGSRETFLTLMLAQLENQDPFQPMEDGQFLTQLAQFEMVSGVNAMQQGFDTLADSMLSNQVLESAALVGKIVFAERSLAQLGEGGTVEGAVVVPNDARSINISVHSATGEFVREMTIPAAPGRQSFVWDGLDARGAPLPAGTYRITAEADTARGPAAASVLLGDVVRSVTIGGRNEPPQLNLAGGERIDLASVLEIR